MNASIRLLTRPVRRRQGAPPGRGPRSREVLLAGCDRAACHTLIQVCGRLGLRCTEAHTFDAVVDQLQRGSFALWVLDARHLPLDEPIVWASLRFAGEHGKGLRRSGHRAGGVTLAPVLVLVPAGDQQALSALSAAASTPTITGWNRSGWNLGVQEMPCADARLKALIRRMLAERRAPAALPV